MDINNLYDAAEDLVEAVNDAVRRNDFSGLSSSIKKTVKDVSETIQRDVRVYLEAFRSRGLLEQGD